MSHYRHRAEKNCLNCGNEVNLNYCGKCGQENIEPNISFWHLVTHFFNDITHFDGKFFSTLKKLISRPGLLSFAYVKGERMRYLDPVRMYIFTSFLFFLLFFSFNKGDVLKENVLYNGKSMEEINMMDSATFSNFSKYVNDSTPLTRAQFKEYLEKEKNKKMFNSKEKYTSLSQFDSLNKRGQIKGNIAEKIIKRKQIEIEKKYNNNQEAYLRALWQSISHSFPQLLFISLPLFALSLKLLYIRHKNIFFTQHIIYAIHLYIFSFIILFGVMLSSYLNKYIGALGVFFMLGLFIWSSIYEYKAMRRFYGQRRIKTFIKFLLATFFRFFIILFLFIIFSVISFYKS